MEVRYFTADELIQANGRAVKTNRNRFFDPDKLNEILEDNERRGYTLYPVTFSMVHNEREVRVMVVLNEDGDQGLLDIPSHTFNGLRTAVLDTNPEEVDVDSLPKLPSQTKFWGNVL